jgi:hypothetical protein
MDNALWDLRGKARGDPVEPERAAAAAREHQRRGYTAQKWFFKYGPSAGSEGMQRNLSMARAVREAVGPGYRLMFDAFMGWDSLLDLQPPPDGHGGEKPLGHEPVGQGVGDPVTAEDRARCEQRDEDVRLDKSEDGVREDAGDCRSPVGGVTAEPATGYFPVEAHRSFRVMQAAVVGVYGRERYSRGSWSEVATS